ncbi:MAG TPA: methylmalonyl-CoA mutase family protein, partial [Actinomycetota bacterium]
MEAEAAARVERDVADWEQGELAAFLRRRPEGKEAYLTGSRRPVNRVYTPADVAQMPWEDVGLPGRYPFTRGPYPTMYRGRVWTMRQIAGFGVPSDTNRRFQYLIA